jgi:hypothetical protein
LQQPSGLLFFEPAFCEAAFCEAALCEAAFAKQLCVNKLPEATQRLEAALLLQQPGRAGSFFA